MGGKGLRLILTSGFCLLFIVSQAHAAADGSIGPVSEGTARVNLWVEPAIQPLADENSLRASARLYGKDLEIDLVSNLDPVDYSIKSLNSHTDSLSSAFPIVPTKAGKAKVKLDGVLDKLLNLPANENQPTLILIASPHP